MGRELGVGDIEQQEIGVPACGQLDRALRRDTCAISGDQNEVAEYDLALHKVQPRSTLGRAEVPVRWTICGLTSGHLDALVVIDDEDVPRS